jgi:hypothetical protein
MGCHSTAVVAGGDYRLDHLNQSEKSGRECHIV